MRLFLFQINDDDTVGAAGAIDGGGSGIFQDIDALNIVGIDPVDGGLESTVYDEQRLRTGVDGILSPDGDFGPLDRNAGTFPLNHLVNIPIVRHVRIQLYTGNSGGEISPQLFSIADINHFLRRNGSAVFRSKENPTGREEGQDGQIC